MLISLAPGTIKTWRELWDEVPQGVKARTHLIHSPRYASVHDLQPRLGDVFSEAAKHVGPFLETNLDIESVHILLSEGIFVREGKLQPRLRFRHHLLRDFALCQWCLSADSPVEAAHRWGGIQGGLHRYGALRAICEALLDPDAPTEYPGLDSNNVIQEVLRIDNSQIGIVAQVLGTLRSSEELDPANWPTRLQSSLPTHFGQDLIAAARMEENGSWAVCIGSTS